MENKTVYISGAISSDRKYKEKFETAEERLRKKGYEVINPVIQVKRERGKSWIRYLIECLEVIDKEKPNMIYLLKNWASSYGAKIERLVFMYFKDAGKDIVIQAEREDI